MTDRDDILRMAREAGLAIDTSDRMSTSRETHFWVEGCYFDIERFFWQAYDAGAAAEREACARVCDDLAKPDIYTNYYRIAARAIRARGDDNGNPSF